MQFGVLRGQCHLYARLHGRLSQRSSNKEINQKDTVSGVLFSLSSFPLQIFIINRFPCVFLLFIQLHQHMVKDTAHNQHNAGKP